MLDDMKVLEENPKNCLEDEADDDTFSLSEFLMYRETTSNGDEQDQLREDHDSFEFFNHTKINNYRPFPPENIIFCGNIIPTGKPKPENTPNLKEKYYQTSRKEIANSSSMEIKQHQSTNKRIENRKKGGGGGGGGKNTNVMAHKVTILRSSTRWQLYAFGMTKVPMEMELSDIRSRQSRRGLIRPIDHQQSRRSTSNNQLVGMNEKVSIGCSNSVSRSGGKGLWGIIREFGCSYHPNTMVKASLVCIPSV